MANGILMSGQPIGALDSNFISQARQSPIGEPEDPYRAMADALRFQEAQATSEIERIKGDKLGKFFNALGAFGAGIQGRDPSQYSLQARLDPYQQLQRQSQMGIAQTGLQRQEDQQKLTAGAGSPAAIQNRRALFAILEDPNAPDWKKKAARIELALDPRPSSAGAKVVMVEMADGTSQPFLQFADGSVQPFAAGFGGGQPGGETPTGADGQPPAGVTTQDQSQFISRTPEEEAAAVTTAKEEAKQDIKRKSMQPKARSAALAARSKVDRLTELIDQVIPRVTPFTAGFGSWLAGLPASRARDLQADIDTIKANMGFSELQEMRDNSPTGGALGQVTEREIAFLQSLVANLEQSQSDDQLRRNLEIVRREVQNSWRRVADAYEQQYGEPLVTPEGAGTQGGQQQADAVNWGDL